MMIAETSPFSPDDAREDPLPEKRERDPRNFATAQIKRIAEHYHETGRTLPVDHPTYGYYPGLEQVTTKPTEIPVAREKYIPGSAAKKEAIDTLDKAYWIAFAAHSVEPSIEDFQGYLSRLVPEDEAEVLAHIEQLRQQFGFGSSKER